jgi:AcrR family transcriptional regulator
MEEQKLPRREREKLVQRQEMLAAALDLFSRKGYPNVSMQEIAEKAEFAIGTLYKFFKSKEDLYRALVREQARIFHDELSRAIGEPEDEVEKLRNFVKAKGEVFRANAAMIRIYFSETQGARHNVLAGFDSETRDLHESFMKSLASIFESGMQRGRLRRIADPYYLAVALENMTNGFLFLWLYDPGRYPDLEDPDTMLNILFKGLIA